MRVRARSIRLEVWRTRVNAALILGEVLVSTRCISAAYADAVNKTWDISQNFGTASSTDRKRLRRAEQRSALERHDDLGVVAVGELGERVELQDGDQRRDQGWRARIAL